MDVRAPRTAWRDFPPLFRLADEDAVRSHPSYNAAKCGANQTAAVTLLRHFLTREHVLSLQAIVPKNTILVAAHAVENDSVNLIPATYAAMLALMLRVEFSPQIIQMNRVGHTKANGWKRLATPALFKGHIDPSRRYFLIDDFVGMGGTLANLKGYIETQGGEVLGGTVLTGKEKSVILAPDAQQILALREKYGSEFEHWWIGLFGYGFEFLTAAEAGFLARQTKNADTVRAGILSAMRGGD